MTTPQPGDEPHGDTDESPATSAPNVPLDSVAPGADANGPDVRTTTSAESIGPNGSNPDTTGVDGTDIAGPDGDGPGGDGTAVVDPGVHSHAVDNITDHDADAAAPPADAGITAAPDAAAAALTAQLRDLAPPADPTAVRRALARLHSDPRSQLNPRTVDEPVDVSDELAARRHRRADPRRWVVAAAASLVLVVGLGAAIYGLWPDRDPDTAPVATGPQTASPAEATEYLAASGRTAFSTFQLAHCISGLDRLGVRVAPTAVLGSMLLRDPPGTAVILVAAPHVDASRSDHPGPTAPSAGAPTSDDPESTRGVPRLRALVVPANCDEATAEVVSERIVLGR